ncbi:MAG: formimidoylglutamate deiminase [Rhodobacter sp.]|nr:formimidoylglutamate deiminase [Rhodobacter sp.]
MIFARHALLPEGWQTDVRLTISDGRISTLVQAPGPQGDDHVTDCLVPGLSNAHSHSFQRGFSGLTESRAADRDSFWTWRETMYSFALSLTPESVQSLAAMAFVEMLEAGFTRVGEFHYVHHGPDGRPYDDPAELSARIFSAARETGIALTHLPVLYMHGGFGGQSATPEQRRFLNGLDRYLDLVAACDRLADASRDRVGIAPHSLRAVDTDILIRSVAAAPDRPVHIHIAEQEREVADCIAFSGRRPVELLFDQAMVDSNWCLVHATHLTTDETAQIAASGAVAGLCPLTEANLGDGLFPAVAFLAREGRIAIGTDSNVRIDAAEEFRLLEYGQRLNHRLRNVLGSSDRSTGAHLFDAALHGGARALAAETPEIAQGAPADLLGLRDPHSLATGPDTTLDRWIFGFDVTVSDVWAGGGHVVRDGRHRDRDAVEMRFGAALRDLLS